MRKTAASSQVSKPTSRLGSCEGCSALSASDRSVGPIFAAQPHVREQDLASAVHGIRRMDLLLRKTADHFAVMETMTTRDGKPYFRVTFRDEKREVSFPIWGDAPLAANVGVTFSEPRVDVASHGELAREAAPLRLTPQPEGRWRAPHRL